MTPTRQGSIQLFRFAGIPVYLHWSWFIVALIEIQHRGRFYSSLTWNVLEYLALFAIVLMHEFGHSLACRQVGGRADQIVLWPLGGVAYVAPPPRPGTTLWSIAAGPLVNVILAPILTFLYLQAPGWGWLESMPDLFKFIQAICMVNYVLLVFNLMPVYPLDGGQILQSLLWFVLGRARSLMVTVIIGFAGVAGLFALAAFTRSVWTAIMAGFILLNCWRGLGHARMLAKIAALPRHAGFACPNCLQAPIRGAHWQCGNCQAAFDTFESNAACPNCATPYPVTVCPECGVGHSFNDWKAR